MSGQLSPSGVRTKAWAYEDFQGIDASRDKNALETGQKQHMIGLENGYADWRGVILRDPAARKRSSNNQVIQHVRFVGRDFVSWAQKDGGGITLTSDREHDNIEVYPKESIVSSTSFNNKAVYMTRGQDMWLYDGLSWKKNTSPARPQPHFGVAIQRRLAIAGMRAKSREIWFSRVDNENIMPEDEDLSSTDKLKAALLDISNVIGTADEITGLGVFETNRLAVFTNDQVVVFSIDPDFTRWAIDDKANVRVGCLSHNTIAQAGSDLLFCSRSGVHSLRRSDNNGLTIYSVPMSAKIDMLYKQLVRLVPDPQMISAFYDQDTGQYHVFFPQAGDLLCTRLTMTISPVQGDEVKWSTSTFLHARCGASLGGVTVLGTSGGLYTLLDVEDEGVDDDIVPELVVTTPVLWHGAINDVKETYSIIVQASGKTTMTIDAFDDQGRQIGSITLNVDDSAADDNFPDVPLQRQYERKFDHRYRGVQFRFKAQGRGLVRLIGFAVTVRKS